MYKPFPLSVFESPNTKYWRIGCSYARVLVNFAKWVEDIWWVILAGVFSSQLNIEDYKWEYLRKRVTINDSWWEEMSAGMYRMTAPDDHGWQHSYYSLWSVQFSGRAVCVMRRLCVILNACEYLQSQKTTKITTHESFWHETPSFLISQICFDMCLCTFSELT